MSQDHQTQLCPICLHFYTKEECHDKLPNPQWINGLIVLKTWTIDAWELSMDSFSFKPLMYGSSCSWEGQWQTLIQIDVGFHKQIIIAQNFGINKTTCAIAFPFATISSAALDVVVIWTIIMLLWPSILIYKNYHGKNETIWDNFLIKPLRCTWYI